MANILIANRGEIACRIIRAAQALGHRALAVHSEADAQALHVEMADDARAIGPAKPAESYLKADVVLAAGAEMGADAVHPGYGFLAENAGFAAAVGQAGLRWIGPSGDSIRDMGDKQRARDLAVAAGVPVVPGSPRLGPDDPIDADALLRDTGLPVLVKATAGGGGIGMRRVDDAGQLLDAIAATQKLAGGSFGDATVYVEKLVSPARHIEIQVFGFGDGRAVHLFERECSIQRRFQKIVEESPAPGLKPETRAAMASAAVRLAEACNYEGAGTVEFIVGPDQDFYFLEMNTRIQVEHPVTEMITGVDLVQAQIRHALGEDISAELAQDKIAASGHAIEARVYAERPEMNFLPSPGAIAAFDAPGAADGLRIDAGVRAGDQVTIHYDPTLAKVIAHGADRDAALDRLDGALAGFGVEGVSTNIAFLRRLLEHPAFRDGDVSTGFVTDHIDALK